MRLGDDGLGRLLVRVDVRAVGEAPSLEKPRETGVVGSELGQLDSVSALWASSMDFMEAKAPASQCFLMALL